MNISDCKTPDSASPAKERVIDKPRVLAHLQQMLAELSKEKETDNGGA